MHFICSLSTLIKYITELLYYNTYTLSNIKRMIFSHRLHARNHVILNHASMENKNCQCAKSHLYFIVCFSYVFQLIFPVLSVAVPLEAQHTNTTSDDAPPCKVIDKVLNCSQMSLTHNDLLSINTPDYNTSITMVKLEHNKLDDVPGAFLEQFESLEEIYLDENALVLIPVSILNMDMLMVLSLQNNAIKLKRSLYFQQMTELKILNLKHNKIDELRNRVFAGLRNLESLYLDNNNIVTIHQEAFKELENLDMLNLAGNQIKIFVAEQFKYMKKLFSLDVSENEIEHIDKNAFSSMDGLGIIRLAGNRITQLERDAFKHLSLFHAEIGDNQLTELDDVFSENFITYLDVSNNSLTKLPKVHSKDFVFHLDISHNKFVNFPPDAFEGYEWLHQFLIQGNPLTAMPVLSELTNLETISASDTLIEHIYPCNFANLPKLKEFFWHNSPIACDCDIGWLRKWFDESLDEKWREKIMTNEIFHWKCASPSHLAGKIFHELKEEDFVCHPERDAHYCSNHPLEQVHLKLSVLDVTDIEITLNYTINATSEVEANLQQVSWNSTAEKHSTLLHVITNPVTVNHLQPLTMYTVCINLFSIDQHRITAACSTATTSAIPTSGIMLKHHVGIGGLLVVLLLMGMAVGSGIYVYKRPPGWLIRRWLLKHPTGGIVNSVYDPSGDGKVDINVLQESETPPEENGSSNA